jgi:shikimate kinase
MLGTSSRLPPTTPGRDGVVTGPAARRPPQASQASAASQASVASVASSKAGTGDPRHIALIGMMAVGKTTVGRILAEKVNRTFVDNDALVVERVGLSIAEIFAVHGEAYFRVAERDAIEDTLKRKEPVVLSLGGGAVVAPENRGLLRSGAFVVWLRADPITLLARIGDGSSRPMLAADPAGALLRLDEERRDLYASTAHFALEVDRRSARWLAAAIARRVRS